MVLEVETVGVRSSSSNYALIGMYHGAYLKVESSGRIFRRGEGLFKKWF